MGFFFEIAENLLHLDGKFAIMFFNNMIIMGEVSKLRRRRI